MNPISPWSYDIDLVSPDKVFTAVYHDSREVAMGAPTTGKLEIRSSQKSILISDHSGASMIWSEDSRLLAFSEWTQSKNQKICILRLSDFSIYRYQQDYRVIEFHEFPDSYITGIDSPIHRSKHFSISCSAVFEGKAAEQGAAANP